MSSYLIRAQMLLDARRPADAEREARAGLAQEPQNIRLMHALGRALLAQKKVKEAQTVAKDLVAAAPNWENAHLLMGVVELKIGRNKAAEACMREAVRLSPNSTVAHINLGLCHSRSNDLNAALAEAELALAQDAHNKDALNLRAHALTRLGRFEEGRETLRQSLQLDPEAPETHNTAGWACLENEDAAGALEFFLQAMRHDPNNSSYRQGLVHALRAQHAPYRVILGFKFWIARQAQPVRLVVSIGLVMVMQSLRVAAIDAPITGPLQAIFGVIAILFLLMIWMPGPLFDLVLMFDRKVRPVLDARQRRHAYIMGGLLALTTIVIGIALVFAPHS